MSTPISASDVTEFFARVDMVEDAWFIWSVSGISNNRASFARWVTRMADKSDAYGKWWKAAMFRRFDGKRYDDIIWKDLKRRG